MAAMIQTSLFALLEMSTVVMLVTGVFLKKECQKTYDNRDLPMNIHLAAKSLVKWQWSMSVFPVSYWVLSSLNKLMFKFSAVLINNNQVKFFGNVRHSCGNSKAIF